LGRIVFALPVALCRGDWRHFPFEIISRKELAGVAERLRYMGEILFGEDYYEELFVI